MLIRSPHGGSLALSTATSVSPSSSSRDFISVPCRIQAVINVSPSPLFFCMPAHRLSFLSSAYASPGRHQVLAAVSFLTLSSFAFARNFSFTMKQISIFPTSFEL